MSKIIPMLIVKVKSRKYSNIRQSCETQAASILKLNGWSLTITPIFLGVFSYRLSVPFPMENNVFPNFDEKIPNSKKNKKNKNNLIFLLLI